MKLYSITYEDSDAVEHHISFAPTRREARAISKMPFAEDLREPFGEPFAHHYRFSQGNRVNGR